MMSILKIRRDERWLIPLAFVLMVALNALMVAYHHELFTRGGNIGYWGMFTRYYTVSGYDDLTYVTLSNWKIYYPLYRHPLLSVLMYPLYLLNVWQMDYTEMNLAIYIVAAVLVVCGVGSVVLIHRILRELVGVGRWEALLLTLLYYSFAHVMVGSFVPDHYGLSHFLLLLTLYAAGRALRRGSPMGRWRTALLFLLTTGVTLTNGCKTMLAALFCARRKFWEWRYLLTAAVLPAVLLLGAYLWQHYAIQLPEDRANELRMEQRMKTDPKFAAERKKSLEWRKTHGGDKLVDSPYFEWTDKSTSRVRATVENLFGEAAMLHSDYLLQDTNETRPNYVSYRYMLQYAVPLLLMLLFLLGILAGRHDRLIHLCLAWFSIDIMLHLVLGFAILEVYIMTLHWMFFVPIAIGCLLKATSGNVRKGLCSLLLALAVYLWIYNGWLVVEYMV